MRQAARHTTPKPILPPELEERFADVDRRSADCYAEQERQMAELEDLTGANEGHVSAELIGDTAVHHMRLAARAGRRLMRGEKA
jgi:hypothetical protein